MYCSVYSVKMFTLWLFTQSHVFCCIVSLCMKFYCINITIWWSYMWSWINILAKHVHGVTIGFVVISNENTHLETFGLSKTCCWITGKQIQKMLPLQAFPPKPTGISNLCTFNIQRSSNVSSEWSLQNCLTEPFLFFKRY